MRAVVLSIALALVAAPAHAATVSIVAAGGTAQTVELPPPDVVDRAYTVLAADGTSAERVVTGTSLGALLRAASADVDPFVFAEVSAGGAAATLTRADALDGDPPGVFVADATGVRFLRHGAEELAGAPVVRLRERARLSVRARFTPRNPDPGDEVTFSATVDGATEDVALSWWFDDGRAQSRDPKPRHAFAEPGRYRVVVGATTASDPAGAAGFVTVRVGDGADPESEDDETDATAGAPAAPSGGGATARSAGADAGDAPAAAATTADRPAPKRAPRRTKPPRTQPAAPPAEPVVAGELISLASTSAPAPSAPAPSAASAGPSFSIPPATWVGAAAVLLLALAVARELRHSQPEWT